MTLPNNENRYLTGQQSTTFERAAEQAVVRYLVENWQASGEFLAGARILAGHRATPLELEGIEDGAAVPSHFKKLRIVVMGSEYVRKNGMDECKISLEVAANSRHLNGSMDSFDRAVQGVRVIMSQAGQKNVLPVVNEWEDAVAYFNAWDQDGPTENGWVGDWLAVRTHYAVQGGMLNPAL